MHSNIFVMSISAVAKTACEWLDALVVFFDVPPTLPLADKGLFTPRALVVRVFFMNCGEDIFIQGTKADFRKFGGFFQHISEYFSFLPV